MDHHMCELKDNSRNRRALTCHTLEWFIISVAILLDGFVFISLKRNSIEEFHPDRTSMLFIMLQLFLNGMSSFFGRDIFAIDAIANWNFFEAFCILIAGCFVFCFEVMQYFETEHRFVTFCQLDCSQGTLHSQIK